MEMPGKVEGGVVVPQGVATLPEGRLVRIVYAHEESAEVGGKNGLRPRRRVKFPLVESNTPGALRLTNDVIAELLNEDDLSA